MSDPRRNHAADLAHHLAAFSLFEARPKSTPIPNFQPLPLHFSSLDPAAFAHSAGPQTRNRAATYNPDYNLVRPHPQVESLRFLEARARVLHNRSMPVQGRIGGTGVFLPRIANPSSTFTKNQGPRNTREAQQRYMVKRDELEEQCCQFSTSPEMVLPQDWTY